MSAAGRVRACSRAALAGLLATAWPSVGLAQQPLSSRALMAASAVAPQVSSAQGPGPLRIEPIHSGPVVAPEVRFTEVDGDTGTLVGGYGGWLHDEAFLIGGGGYWLVNHTHDLEMFYGGVVVGWTVPLTGSVRFGARGLVGGGWAEVDDSFEVGVPGLPNRPGRPMPGGGQTIVVRHVRFGEDFFVFEPQADVSVRLTPWLRLVGGVGYRVVAAQYDLDDRLRGVTGSLALQFGGGS